jgi:hypothetical protein
VPKKALGEQSCDKEANGRTGLWRGVAVAAVPAVAMKAADTAWDQIDTGMDNERRTGTYASDLRTDLIYVPQACL